MYIHLHTSTYLFDFWPYPIMLRAYSWFSLKNHSWQSSEDHMECQVLKLGGTCTRQTFYQLYYLSSNDILIYYEKGSYLLSHGDSTPHDSLSMAEHNSWSQSWKKPLSTANYSVSCQAPPKMTVSLSHAKGSHLYCYYKGFLSLKFRIPYNITHRACMPITGPNVRDQVWVSYIYSIT